MAYLRQAWPEGTTMATRTEQTAQVDVTPQMLSAMRQGDHDQQWLAEYPDALEPFRGQWVVVHKGQIVGHSRDGREVAHMASTARHSGALLEYVPTHEETNAFRVSTPMWAPPPDNALGARYSPGDESSSRSH